jgi:hypothetical protein
MAWEQASQWVHSALAKAELDLLSGAPAASVHCRNPQVGLCTQNLLELTLWDILEFWYDCGHQGQLESHGRSTLRQAYGCWGFLQSYSGVDERLQQSSAVEGHCRCGLAECGTLRIIPLCKHSLNLWCHTHLKIAEHWGQAYKLWHWGILWNIENKSEMCALWRNKSNCLGNFRWLHKHQLWKFWLLDIHCKLKQLPPA